MAGAADTAVECYAQRLLNPFRGVAQVIRHAAAEAVSTDGVHWDIYVSNSALLSGLEQQGQGQAIQISDIRYGGWSADQGLKRGPLYPSEDFRQMEAMGAVVYAHLLKVHDQVPFPFRDSLELWLLDESGAPLALLDSAVHDREGHAEPLPRWHAGYTAEARFHSPAMERLAGAGADNAAARLTRYVNDRAGPRPAAQWFRRREDGSGDAGQGVNLAAGWVGRRLPAANFPAWLLADAGGDAAHQALLDDYRDWLAPCLLLLWDLADADRARLEQRARLRAEEVCRLRRLYPRVLDPGFINAARVQARLCGSAAARQPAEDHLPTYYIELNPSGAE